MKQLIAKKTPLKAAIRISTLLLCVSFVFFSSFTAAKFADDFLKQLGISKVDADEKITNSILGGSIDTYGVKNVKNIVTGNRKAVALDLLAYSKNQVRSAAFIKQYNYIRDNNKPKLSIARTPEEFRAQNIELAKKSLSDVEAMLKKADAANKAMFEKILVDANKNLKEMEDPNSKINIRYSRNFETLAKDIKNGNDAQLADWERSFPANHLVYVKVRLQEFMNETKDIDFGAELVARNGKKYFVNPDYERKGNRWKMAFRAGKEVVEPAREFVQKWMDEIK